MVQLRPPFSRPTNASRSPHAIHSTHPPRTRRSPVSLSNLASVTLLTCSARQRTFEAAYWRTSLGQFSFALVILKIFQKEFYAIGGTSHLEKMLMEVLYTVFGFVMILVAALRRTRSNEEFFVDGHGRYFRTSGRVVLVTSLLALSLYINLIILLLSQ